MNKLVSMLFLFPILLSAMKKESRTYCASESGVHTVVTNTDASRIMLLYRNGYEYGIRLLDRSGRKLDKLLNTKGSHITAGAMSPSGKKFAIGTDLGVISLWHSDENNKLVDDAAYPICGHSTIKHKLHKLKNDPVLFYSNDPNFKPDSWDRDAVVNERILNSYFFHTEEDDKDHSIKHIAVDDNGIVACSVKCERKVYLLKGGVDQKGFTSIKEMGACPIWAFTKHLLIDKSGKNIKWREKVIDKMVIDKIMSNYDGQTLEEKKIVASCVSGDCSTAIQVFTSEAFYPKYRMVKAK